MRRETISRRVRLDDPCPSGSGWSFGCTGARARIRSRGVRAHLGEEAAVPGEPAGLAGDHEGHDGHARADRDLEGHPPEGMEPRGGGSRAFREDDDPITLREALRSALDDPRDGEGVAFRDVQLSGGLEHRSCPPLLVERGLDREDQVRLLGDHRADVDQGGVISHHHAGRLRDLPLELLRVEVQDPHPAERAVHRAEGPSHDPLDPARSALGIARRHRGPRPRTPDSRSARRSRSRRTGPGPRRGCARHESTGCPFPMRPSRHSQPFDGVPRPAARSSRRRRSGRPGWPRLIRSEPGAFAPLRPRRVRRRPVRSHPRFFEPRAFACESGPAWRTGSPRRLGEARPSRAEGISSNSKAPRDASRLTVVHPSRMPYRVKASPIIRTRSRTVVPMTPPTPLEEIP